MVTLDTSLNAAGPVLCLMLTIMALIVLAMA